MEPKRPEKHDWFFVLLVIGLALFIGGVAMIGAMKDPGPYQNEVNDLIWNKGPWLTMSIGKTVATFESLEERVVVTYTGPFTAPTMDRTFPQKRNP